MLRDPEQQAYKAFGLDALPTVVIISDGKIVLKHVEKAGNDRVWGLNDLQFALINKSEFLLRH